MPASRNEIAFIIVIVRVHIYIPHIFVELQLETDSVYLRFGKSAEHSKPAQKNGCCFSIIFFTLSVRLDQRLTHADVGSSLEQRYLIRGSRWLAVCQEGN